MGIAIPFYRIVNKRLFLKGRVRVPIHDHVMWKPRPGRAPTSAQSADPRQEKPVGPCWCRPLFGPKHINFVNRIPSRRVVNITVAAAGGRFRVGRLLYSKHHRASNKLLTETRAQVSFSPISEANLRASLPRQSAADGTSILTYGTRQLLVTCLDRHPMPHIKDIMARLRFLNEIRQGPTGRSQVPVRTLKIVCNYAFLRD